MGTRSTIALEFADGTVEQVYCHWDGYLVHNGCILNDSYMDPFKVKALVALGGFSSLQETVEETAGQAYTQRGEGKCINKYKNFDEYVREGQREEYNYILRDSAAHGGATWFVEFYATEGEWITMEAARLAEQEIS